MAVLRRSTHGENKISSSQKDDTRQQGYWLSKKRFRQGVDVRETNLRFSVRSWCLYPRPPLRISAEKLASKSVCVIECIRQLLHVSCRTPDVPSSYSYPTFV